MIDIGKQLNEIMGDYVEEVKAVSKKEIRAVAKECVQKLKATSPRREKGGTPGAYASSWTVKTVGDEVIVHNKDHYQLTHLLEHGHALRQGGRARAIEHIAPVEAWAVDELPKRIEDELGG